MALASQLLLWFAVRQGSAACDALKRQHKLCSDTVVACLCPAHMHQHLPLPLLHRQHPPLLLTPLQPLAYLASAGAMYSAPVEGQPSAGSICRHQLVANLQQPSTHALNSCSVHTTNKQQIRPAAITVLPCSDTQQATLCWKLWARGLAQVRGRQCLVAYKGVLHMWLQNTARWLARLACGHHAGDTAHRAALSLGC